MNVSGANTGILIHGRNNHIKGNTANNNQGAGISVCCFDSHNNKLNGNTALGNALDLFDNNVNCDKNKWTRNVFNTSNFDCIK